MVKEDFEKKIQSMIESGEIIEPADVKSYHGIFTGKLVKPVEGDEDFKLFKKGDSVIVMDYEEFHKGVEYMLLRLDHMEKTHNIVSNRTQDILSRLNGLD